MSTALLSIWWGRLVPSPAERQWDTLAVLVKPRQWNHHLEYALEWLAGPFQKPQIIQWANLISGQIYACLQKWDCHIVISQSSREAWFRKKRGFQEWFVALQFLCITREKESKLFNTLPELHSSLTRPGIL